MATDIIKKPSGSGAELLVEQYEEDDITLAANGYTTKEFMVDKFGYEVLGVVGYTVANATSGGSNSSWCAVRSAFCYVNSYDQTVCQLNFRNYGSSQAKLRARAYILYQKA